MYKLRELFYKAVFKTFIKNKTQRKFLTRCFAKVGIRGYFNLKQLVKQESAQNQKFKYNVSVVCIAKNEGDYFQEWIEYHKLIGDSLVAFFIALRYSKGSSDTVPMLSINLPME